MRNISNRININGKHIYYEIFPQFRYNEEKPYVIFLHEGLGSVEQWRDIPKTTWTKSKNPVLVYDRYGYGKSDKLTEPRNAQYLHEEAYVYLPELLTKLNINKKVILVGHSDGGTIALLFASKFPEKVLGVITEADHIFCEDITYEGIRQAKAEFENGALKELLEKYHNDKTESMFYGWADVWLSEKNKKWNIENEISNIKCPVVAIQGKNDNYGSEKQLLIKKQKIKAQTDIFHIDNCGHIPHFQAKKIVLEIMLNFIKHFDFV